MDLEVDGKVALITGSTKGIGKAIAETFAIHGIKVIVSGRDRQEGEETVNTINAAGGNAVFLYADLLEINEPNQLVHQAYEVHNRLDIIVNNAAMVCNKPAEEVTNQDWDQLFTVNLKAPFFIIQAALPFLKETNGSVINISSINALKNNNNNFIYDSLKAALNQMTRGLALDFRGEGIRFNALMPGGTHTPNLNQWFSQVYKSDVALKQNAEEIKNDPSIATPQQIADAVLLFASAKSDWINGAIIPLEGGYTLG